MSNERCEGICRCEGLSDEGKFFARVLRTFVQYATPVTLVEDPREVFTLVEDPREVFTLVIDPREAFRPRNVSCPRRRPSCLHLRDDSCLRESFRLNTR